MLRNIFQTEKVSMNVVPIHKFFGVFVERNRIYDFVPRITNSHFLNFLRGATVKIRFPVKSKLVIKGVLTNILDDVFCQPRITCSAENKVNDEKKGRFPDGIAAFIVTAYHIQTFLKGNGMFFVDMSGKFITSKVYQHSEVPFPSR